MPKFSVSPVDSITYCSESAIGATKVSEVTGAGLKSSAPRYPVANQPAATSSPTMMPAATCPHERRNGACANAKMIRAPLMVEAASIRANFASRWSADSSAGTEVTFADSCDHCSIAMREGAIRPFRVICATIPSTITTTKERKLPLPSSTSARDPQPFDITMP